jgi:delta-aminolevulinic acid dehydratase/porphobilinogen synthase
MRRMVAETRVVPAQLMLPVFVKDHWHQAGTGS